MQNLLLNNTKSQKFRNFGGIIGMAMLWGYDGPADIIAKEYPLHRADKKKKGLSTPAVDHPLFKTPLAEIPSERPGYDPEADGIFQLVLRNE